MIGLRQSATRCQLPMKSPCNAAMKFMASISLTSAPAANARSEPVSTMTAIWGSASNAPSA